MKIKIESPEQGIEKVYLEGELDFQNSQQIRLEFTRLIDKKPIRVLVNLEHVSYIDSSGLAVFIELFQKMKRLGGRLAFFNLQERVRNVFEIAKLESIFHLAGSEQEALTLLTQ
ncbi:MAG: STAS domain-containing protein [Candidatus Omnitrophica bacterium]|nr:STAS domain-containing protein [Candidatus Omnitrophota bacterium]